jgi:hypothetical protein
MYEGDSGAPKERFVTIEELELAGIIGTKVQNNFALIDKVLGAPVSQGQQAGYPEPVRIEGSGGNTLFGLSDTSVGGARAKDFLQYNGGAWVNRNLFGTLNVWTELQQFNDCIKIAGLDSGYVDFCHDSTDLNITGSATTDANLIGLNLRLDNARSIDWLDSNNNSKELLIFENIGGGGGVITDDYFEQDVTERQVTSSTYVDAPGGLQIIDKSALTDAEKYFFVINTGCGNSVSDNTNDNYIRLTDDAGTSTVSGSEGRYTQQHDADGDQYGYSGTFVNSISANDIEVQLKQAGSVQASVSQDFRAWAFNVNKFSPTQFYEAEDTTSRTVTAVYPTYTTTSTASVTVGAGDWLFMSHATLTFDSGTFRICAVGLIDGSGTETTRFGEWRAENTTAVIPTSHWWYEAGLTGSTVRKTGYSQNTDGQSTVTHAHMAAVSLDAFAEHYVTQDLASYGAGTVASGDTTRLSISFTAQNTGEFVALAMIRHGWNASGSSGTQRIDVDINAGGATTVSNSSQFQQFDNTRAVQMQCIPIASFSVTQGDSVDVDYIHTSAASDTTQTLDEAQLVVFALEVTSSDTFTIGDPAHDNLIDGTATKIDSTLNVTGATDLDSTLNVDGAATFQSTTDHFDGSTWHVQTGISPITIDGDVGDTTTPLIDILNTGTNVDRRLIRFREEANEGFYIDGDFSFPNPNNALVIGTDIVGAVGEMLWMKQDGDWRFGTDRVVYDYSARILDMPSTDIDLSNAGFGDRINFYGGLGGALSASIGNESTIDIFLKAAQVHRWYVGTNADLGASNYMYLNVNELGLERDIDLFQADAATATHSWRSAWNNPDYDWTFTGTTDLNISGLTGGVVIDSNLTVSGTTTTINSNTVAIADNIILLNSDEAGAPTQDAGLEVERGTSANVFFQYDETADRWEFTNDGSTYYFLMTMADGTVTDSVLRWSGTAWDEETLVRVSDAGAFSIFDSDTTDSVVMSHSGGVTPSRVFTIATTNTDYVDITGIVNPGGLRLRDGAQFEIYDPTDSSYLVVNHDGSDVNWTGVNTTDFTVDGLTWFKLLAGGGLAIYDSTNADEANFSHDGTDFNTNFVSTTDWNINGLRSLVFDDDISFRAGAGREYRRTHMSNSSSDTTTWYKIADVSIPSGTFNAVGFQLIVTREGTNFGYNERDTERFCYTAGYTRSITTDGDTETGWVNSTFASAPHIRLVRPSAPGSTSDFELQFRADLTSKAYTVDIKVETEGSWVEWITWHNLNDKTAGTTTGTVYSFGNNSAADGGDHFFNLWVNGNLKVWDDTGVDSGLFRHDGTDFVLECTNTTDWNITGITAIQAGTVDADFDAITATSYGGILEANLLDKTANETVSGEWDFTDAISVQGSVSDKGIVGPFAFVDVLSGDARFGAYNYDTASWIDNYIRGLNIYVHGQNTVYLRVGSAPATNILAADTATGVTVLNDLDLVVTGEVKITPSSSSNAVLRFDNPDAGTVECALIQDDAGNFVIRPDDSVFTDDFYWLESSGIWVFEPGVRFDSNITFDAVTNTIAGIQNQNLLDKTANEIVSGEWDFTDAISVQGNVSDKGIVGAFVFMDMNGGTGRFGSYNWDAPGWVDCYYTGANVYLNAQNGDVRLQRSNTTYFSIEGTGNVVCNNAAIATTATDGFLYVPSCAGTPTGTPTTKTGRVPIVVDTTNHKLYFYSGGSWRDAGP